MRVQIDRELVEIAASYVQRPYTPDHLYPRPGEHVNNRGVCHHSPCESVVRFSYQDNRVSPYNAERTTVQDV